MVVGYSFRRRKKKLDSPLIGSPSESSVSEQISDDIHSSYHSFMVLVLFNFPVDVHVCTMIIHSLSTLVSSGSYILIDDQYVRIPPMRSAQEHRTDKER